MRRIFTLSLLCILLLSGCMVRDSLYELASTSSSHPGPPSIIVFDPQDGLRGVPRNGLIAMLFSQSMDEASVERNFTYSYKGRRYDALDGAFAWDASSRLVMFKPLAFFPYDAPLGTEVTVRMDYKGQSVDGDKLNSTYEWRFRTSDVTDFAGGSVTNVQGSYPSPGPQGLDTRISVDFDKEVLRSTVEASLLIMSDDFQDTRLIDDGQVDWTQPAEGTFRATYIPDSPLLPGMIYHFLLNNDGMIPVDLTGNPLYLGAFLPFQFQTTS
jgi:hypothetical protein